MNFALQNLDVNLAVNNLLSRDDDETDDHDDGSEAYIPGGNYLTSVKYLFLSGKPCCE